MTNEQLLQAIQMLMAQNQQPQKSVQQVQNQRPVQVPQTQMFNSFDLGQLVGVNAPQVTQQVQTVQQPQVDIAQLVQNEVNKVLGQVFSGLSVQGVQTQQNTQPVNVYADIAQQIAQQQKEATYVGMQDYINQTGQVPQVGEKTLEEQLAELQQKLADKDKVEKERQLVDTLKQEAYKLGYNPQQADYIVSQIKGTVKVDPATGTLVNVQEQIKGTYDTLKSIVQPNEGLLGGVQGVPFSYYDNTQTQPQVQGTVSNMTDEELDNLLFK